MKETKIYIVESSEGEYSDSPSWIEKAFRRKEDAEAFARQLDAVAVGGLHDLLGIGLLPQAVGTGTW